jgi:DNA-binding NtrC family response regulator
MQTSSNARILCVDDEPRILEMFSLLLSSRFQVIAATSGHQGLTLLQDEGPFAVVLSDMRMPGMDGVTFLSQVRQLAPDTIRVLLTGDVDSEIALSAISTGEIYQCVEKPCPLPVLKNVVEAAVEQYRLTTNS